MNLFGQRMKELRKEQKKTQAEMAAAFGVSVRQYQNYEGGAFYPDVAGLMKLADYFDVSTDYLLLENGETTAQAVPTAAPSAESKWPIMRIVWLFTMILAILGKIALRIWASTLPPTVVYNGSDRVGELNGMRNLTETYDVGWLVFLTWFLLLLGLAGTVLYKQLWEFFFGGWLK